MCQINFRMYLHPKENFEKPLHLETLNTVKVKLLRDAIAFNYYFEYEYTANTRS